MEEDKQLLAVVDIAELRAEPAAPRRRLELAPRTGDAAADSLGDARVEALLGHGVEASALVSAEGATLYASPSAERVLGRRAPDRLHPDGLAWVYEPDRAALAAATQRVFADRAEPVSLELRIYLPDGSLRWLGAIASNRLGDPAVAAIIVSFRDITARKTAAEVLQQTERRFRQLVESSPAPILVQVDRKIAYANPATARVLGIPDPGPLIGRSVLEFATPATRARIEARQRIVLEGHQPVEPEPQSFVRPSDGREIHLAVNSVPFVYDGGAAILSIARDVTTSVLAEHELARSVAERDRLIASLEYERGRLGALLEKAPAFICVVRGHDHVIERVNEGFYDIVGRRELVGRSAREALPDLVGQGFIEAADRVFETGTPVTGKGLPARLQRSAGHDLELRYVNIIFQPLVEADGTTTGVFVHGVDVTDETMAERRIRAQFNHLPVPTLVWQRVVRDGVKQFVLLDFNEAANQRSRGRLAAHLGEPAQVFFVHDLCMVEDLERTLDHGEPVHRELDLTMRTTGERRRFAITCASAPPDLVLAHTDDITERRALEQQLRQAHKLEAVGRLAGGVAHDFNNILSVILSYTEMYLDDLKPEDPLRGDIEEIHKAGLRAVGLTRQLLAFSRQQILQPRVIDLNQTLQGLASMLRRLLGEDIELVILTTDRPRGVHADPGQLEQVIMNLAVNARDAMPDGGKLTLETANIDLEDGPAANLVNAKPGPYLVLTVSDTGVGMDSATCAQIFEPFFTTKAPDKGTGLGLATVFGIVHQSGGAISVTSEPGRGSAFRIYLPHAKRRSEPSNIPVMAGAPVGGSETILLVEDDDAVRVLARTILRRSGYNVLDAQNGGEAFLVCEQYPSPIHLLLTDVVMPRMNGRQVAERLLPLRQDMKVLYMSGYTDDAAVLHGIHESGVAFLHKPITSDALLRKVRGVLDDADGGRAFR